MPSSPSVRPHHWVEIILAAAIAFVVGGIAFTMMHSGEGGQTRYTPTDPAKVVSQHLPQVAVVGQKAGPGGTTEVFIQVPGVLNMQSVYVLSDNQTVISGVVLPQLEGGAIPGGQLEMPTGQATVNPIERRANQKHLIDQLLSGGTPNQGQDERRSGGDRTKTSSSGGSPGTAAGNAVTPYRAPVTAQKNSSAADISGDQPIPAPAPRIPEGRSQVSPLAGVDPGRSSSRLKQKNAPAKLSSAIPGADEYQAMVSQTIKTHAKIRKVRGDDGESLTPEEQQQRYYNAVSSMPAVTQGNGDRHLYAFFDPNCPVCHRLYSNLDTYVQDNTLTIHWIPAAVFSQEPSSIGVSAQILAALDAGNDESALSMLTTALGSINGTRDLFEHYDASKHSPHVDGVALGTGLMAVAKPATPLLVFKNQKGDLVIEDGIPAPGWVAQIGRG